MKSFSGLSIGLSLVFGCLLLALVAELYYLLWWKKRIASSEVEDDDNSTNYAKELVHLFCWKKITSLHAPNTTNNNNNNNPDLVKNKGINGVELEPDLELGSSKKGFGEESVECELMRLHNLAGPPRFLFTIKEETKEDLESEDGRSRTKSLSDLMLTLDTPFLSPLPSPPLKSPPLNHLESYNNRTGFNPLFESSTDAELNKLRSSPPPKFKFLRDAEEKLLRRLMMLEAERKVQRSNGGSVQNCGVKAVINSKTVLTEETEGSFLKFIVSSSSSQILPLASSPTTYQTHH